MINGLFFVGVNEIHDACVILPDNGNTDENIVLYINLWQIWLDKL